MSTISQRRIKALLFALCLTNAYSVRAQTNYFEMDLEQLMEVNITGSTLRDESVKTVPSAVTVFTREQLNGLGLDYLHELLALVPGYQVNRNADSPSGYTFSARGRRSSSESREVLLVVDGRVFADSRTGGADGSLPLFPLGQIDRIEVIRGPGSAIYGSGAFNGVINIITRKGENSLKLAATSERGGEARLLASHQDQDWELNFFAHVHKDQGQDYHLTDSFTQNDVHTSDPNQSTDFNVDFRKNNTRLQAAFYRTISEQFYVGETLRNDFNEYSQTFRQLSLEQTLAMSDTLQSRILASYTDIKQLLRFPVLPEGALASLSEPASNDALLADGILAGKTYRIAINNDWTLNKISSVQFGLEWQNNYETQARAKSNFNFTKLVNGIFPVEYYGDITHETLVGSESSRESAGLYGQLLHQLNDKTDLTLGLRYDHYPHIGEHLSPRLGLVYELTQEQNLKLLYGEAFRAPSLSETGLVNNPVLVGNPNLDHEIVKTWDIIWMGVWRNTSLSLDGFHIYYEDPISTGVINSTRTYVNGDAEHSHGVEFEASHQISENWLVRGTYTYFAKLPDNSFREADRLASLLVNYQRGKWSWNMSGVFNGERDLQSNPATRITLDNFWYANTKLRYRVSDAYELSFHIKNVFDKNYSTPAQGYGITNGVPFRGREWRAGIIWNF